MNFKKIMISTGLLATTIAPMGVVVSCGSKSEKFQGYGDLIKNYSNQNEIFKAELTEWIDGDTANFKFWDKNKKGGAGWTSTDQGGKKLSLRIASIDTPELHVPGDLANPTGDLKPVELEWAAKGQEWAAKEVPINQEVRIWKIGSDSYGRWTGSIFYRKDGKDLNSEFTENFSVNLIKQGLTFPRIDDDGAVVSAYIDKNSVLYFIAFALADAENEAKKNKRGLYGLSPANLALAYKKHGIPTNLIQAPVKKFRKKWEKDEEFTKYHIYK